MEEIFKDIPGFAGFYQVSNLGRVKSLKRKHVPKDVILNKAKDAGGYSVVHLKGNNKDKTYHIHTLAAMAFLNHVPNKYAKVVDHIDGNKGNNAIKNLQVISHRENIAKGSGASEFLTGVHIHQSKRKGTRFMARVWFLDAPVHLGTFNSEIEAHHEYLKAIKDITKLREFVKGINPKIEDRVWNGRYKTRE